MSLAPRSPRLLARLADAALAHPLRVLVPALVLFGALALPALRLETDNRPEIFFPEHHPVRERLEALRRDFDPGRTIRVALSGEDLWTPAGVAWMAAVERRLGEVPGVTEAAGLATRYGFADGARTPAPTDLRRRAQASPLARGLGWIARDGETVSILLRVGRETRGSEIAPALAASLEELEAPGRRLEAVGLPILEDALDRSSDEILTRFFPLLVALAAVILLSALGSGREVGSVLLFVGFCLTALLGTFSLGGGALNLVLTVLPPVLFSVALAVSVHLVIRFRDLRAEGREAREAAGAAVSAKGRAVFWAGATTIVGFGSLVTAGVAPVRTLGLAAAAGILIVTLGAFVLLPPLLATTAGSRPGAGRRSFERHAHRIAERAAAHAVARPRRTLLAGAGLALLAAASLPSLEVASNALEYLPADHPLRASVERLESLGLPSATMELVLEGPATLDLGTPAGLSRLAALTGELAAIDGVMTAMGPGTLLEEARQELGGLSLPGGDALLAARLRDDPRSRELLSRLLSPDGRRARIGLGVPLAGYADLDRLEAEIRRRVARTGEQLRITVTGEYPLLLETQRSLLRTLGASLGTSLLVIAGIFLFLLRSARLAAVALVPNLWPVILVLGVMGWAGIPLDVATVMVAAVVLGLAVDDTIHTVLVCRPDPDGTLPRERVVEAVASNGPAYSLTSLLLAVGFGVCALSSFAPTARFGMLAALAMVLVWVGALWGLPALLVLVRSSR